MIFRVFLLFSLVVWLGCSSKEQRKLEEHAVMKKLVMLRTEGLALSEFIEARSTDSSLLQLCADIKNYYRSTHPDFLRVCAGRKIDLTEGDFDTLWNQMSTRFAVPDSTLTQLSLALCIENTEASIATYEEILQRQLCSKDVNYFSFIALPDLYRQQEELYKLHERVGIK